MTLDTVQCSDCGALIDTKSDTPENRTPCPVCGKNGRTFNMFIEDVITLRDGLGVKAKRPSENRPFVEDTGTQGQALPFASTISLNNSKITGGQTPSALTPTKANWHVYSTCIART